MNDDDCYIELPNIKWDKQALIDIMQSYPKESWVNEIKTTKYLRPNFNTVFEDLYKQFPFFEIELRKTFFSELSPYKVLIPHKDVVRKASINFPLIGTWSKSPVCFRTENLNLICEHAYNELFPSVINTTVIHSVNNPTSETRFIFSLSLYEDWNYIKEVLNK